MQSSFSWLDTEVHSWTVQDLTAYIAELFELDYRLQDVQVEGEVSNCRQARSGHLYFTLKDEFAQLKCVMWRSDVAFLPAIPQDGDAVIARGRIAVYKQGGAYQLYVDDMKPAGRGDLAVAFERLKSQLEAEGLFAPEFKKPLPRFPRKIGIVTSADAAALRDILNVLKRRCAFVSVLIAPTLVQGDQAPAQIVRALQWLDGRNDIDTIILARGGGSMEDLWAFNDERVARAIFAARHPIISGVGHETDFTIADFVADVRAPTPSAAAELSVPDMAEMEPVIDGLRAALVHTMRSRLEDHRWHVQALLRNLRHLGPQGQLMSGRQQVDHLMGRLENATVRRLERARGRLNVVSARLQSVSPFATLSRGYAIVRRADGSVVRSVAQVTAGESLRIHVSDGEFSAEVKDEE